MKEHVQEFGVRKYTGNDFIELQSEPLLAIQTLLAEYPPCIIQGCELSEGAENTYDISAGMLSLRGLDAEQNPCTKIVPFAGISGSILPAYFTIAHETQTRVYGNGQSKPIAHAYNAELSTLHPTEGVEFLEITSSGAPRLTDVLGITQKLAQEGGQAKDVLVNFATATTRVLPASGSKLGILMGNVSKWFTDLKALAFKDRIAKTDLDEALAGELDQKVIAQDITNQVKALQIGGVNLLNESKDNVIEGTKRYIVDNIEVPVDSTITLRFDISEKIGVFDNIYVVFEGTNSQGLLATNQTPSIQDFKKGVTDKISWLSGSYNGIVNRVMIFAGLYGANANNSMRVKYAKLEIGEKATDWTPSLADTQAALATKVDKVEGKGLSANDYTTQDKTKLSEFNPKLYRKDLASADFSNELDPNTTDLGLILTKHSNCPKTAYYYIQTLFYKDSNSSRMQIATGYITHNEMYIRYKYDQEPWSPWERMAKESDLYGGHGSLMDADLLDGKHATDFASVYHHHVGTYEPVFAKNTAFNKNFGTTVAGELLIEGQTSPANPIGVAPGNHIHAIPGYATSRGGGFMSKEDKVKLDLTPSGVATTTSNGFMSYWDKIKMNSLFKIICAGEVAANGDKGPNPIGGFNSSRISEGRYKITTSSPWGVMIFVTGSGGYPAATYGRIDTAFYVITTNGTELQVRDAPFSFIVVQF